MPPNANGMSRRDFVKYGSAASAALASAGLAGCLSGGGGGQEGPVAIPDDPDGAVDGESITLAMDAGHNTRPFNWFKDEIQSDTGVSLGEIQGFGFADLPQKLQTEFNAQSDAFDLAVFYPQYLGTMSANNHLTPLDTMMEIDGWDPSFGSLLKPFRQMYTQWGGNTYALPIDGDVLMLVYRKDLFNKHDIDVPETWAEYNEVARYFTEETDDIPYGAATYGKRGFSYGWFLTRFGGAGGVYFDEDMNPQINTEAGRKAMQNLKDGLQYMPDETASYGYAGLRDAFLNEQVAMVVQWTDVPKKAAASDTVSGKWGGAPVPGFEDGRAASAMPVGRVMGVPQYVSDTKKLAAYRFASTFAGPKFSPHMVSDPRCGEDPFRTEHFDDPSVYSSENPFSDDKEGSVAFPSQEAAEEYATAVQATLEQGFPEPYWPGAPQYINALDIEVSKLVSGQVGVDQALQNVEEEWNSIVDELGRESQQEAYSNVIEAWKNAGIWES
jgi:multiple sugar transport system substrate-binding protein